MHICPAFDFPEREIFDCFVYTLFNFLPNILIRIQAHFLSSPTESSD